MSIENTIIDSKNAKDENTTFIPKDTIKRLLLDVKEMIKTPLDDQGIYYKHCEKDMLKGYAMIIGPEDSLYQGGYYFFRFEFPVNYPHSPPNVIFLTNDSFTRMHPNLYKKGKVCLSIINTWKGEQWTGCQTIKSILLTIVSILDKEPFLHEPGITKNHNDFNSYHRAIKYKNIDFCILNVIDTFNTSNLIDIEYKDFFYPLMIKSFEKNISYINKIIDENINNTNENIHLYFYSMTTIINYTITKSKFTTILHRLNIKI